MEFFERAMPTQGTADTRERYASVLIADYASHTHGEAQLIATLEAKFAPHKMSGAVAVAPGRNRRRQSNNYATPALVVPLAATAPASAMPTTSTVQRASVSPRAALRAATHAQPLPHDRALIHTGGGGSSADLAKVKKQKQKPKRKRKTPALVPQNDAENLLISLYGPGAYDASQYVEAGSMSPILPLDPADNLTSDGQNGVSIFKPVDNLGSSVAPVLQYEPAKGSDNLAGDETDLDRRLRELRGPGRKGEFIILFLILIV